MNLPELPSPEIPPPNATAWTVSPDDIRITPPCLMNVRQVALFLGCSLRSVHNYTEAGILPVVRLGRRRIYRRESVLAALAALETKPRRAPR